MKMKLHVLVWALFALVLGSCSKESDDESDLVDPVQVQTRVEVEQQLLQIVNDHRTSMGETILQFSAVAYEYAGEHTEYMIAKGTANHDNFNSRASNISAETNAQAVAENVAKDYDDAAEALENWLQSTDHRNTIEGDFTHTAISVKESEDGQLYFTQLFYR